MDATAASEFQKLVADAIALHKSGRLDEAERSYRAALRIDARPSAPSPTTSASSPPRRASTRDAIGHFDAAIAAEPALRLRALQSRGRARRERPYADAIAGYSRACALEPEHYGSHRALGFLWLAEGERGRALDHFARTYELRRGEDRSGIAAALADARQPAASSCTTPTSSAISQAGAATASASSCMARAYEQVAAGVPAEAVASSRQPSSSSSARTTTPPSTSTARPRSPAAP